MTKIRVATLFCLIGVAGCSSCANRHAGRDGGLASVPSTQHIPLSTAAHQAATTRLVPPGYPLTPDAPAWTWPVSHVVEADGKKTLYVVGWSSQIVDPSLAKQVAEARARTNIVVELSKLQLNQAGVAMGHVSGAIIDKIFRSSSGAYFVEASYPLN